MDGSQSPNPSGPARPPRLWTAEEANARLEELSDLLPQLKGWAVRLGEVHEEVLRLTAFWGRDVDAPDHADHDLKARLDAEWKNLTRRLEESVAGLRAEGIEVKEVESGLVDFYGLVHGEVVFLCWKRGEPSVDFYHTLDGGFRGRRPLPARGRTATPRAPRSGA